MTLSSCNWQVFKQQIVDLAKEIYVVSTTLFKLMIPVLVVVKVLEELGAIPVIGEALQPLMWLVGLPDSMGLVWATTLLIGIYGGLLVYFQVAPSETLTVAQATVLGAMMLIAHNLPVEVRITQKAGVRLGVALLTRIVGALLLGALLYHLYRWGDWLQQPVRLLWQPPVQQPGLDNWVVAQLQSLAMILLIIAGLLTLLRLLRVLHVERLMIWLLRPILRLLGIAPQATSLTIIGMTLGLAFGGGLLIREAQTGHISRKGVFAAMTLLALCHSLIEDTLLVLLLGADLSGVLWLRLLFGLAVVVIVTRLVSQASDSFTSRYLVNLKVNSLR